MRDFCAQCQIYLPPDRRSCPRCGAGRPQADPIVPQWRASLAQSSGEMLIALGLLLVPDQSGALRALALADGQGCWHRQFEYAAAGGLAQAGNLLLVSTYSTDLLRGQGQVWAFDAAGSECWRWPSGRQRVSAPAVADGRVYLTVDGKTLVALDAVNGDERKRIHLSVTATPSAPLVQDGTAYIPCRGPHLLVINVDGSRPDGQRWRFDLAGDPDAWLDKTPVMIDEQLVVVSTSGKAIALDTVDGRLCWQRQVCLEGKPIIAPATDGSHIFVGARDGLHALSLDGQEIWCFSTERKITAAPAVADGVVYVAAHDHHLYALDAASGDELWRVELARRIEVGPALSDDLVVAADYEGNLVAVERVLSAEGYAHRERWGDAASAYIRRGRLVDAAQIYEQRLGQPLPAAELWHAAGDPSRAAPLYEQAQAYDRAEVCYAQLGQGLKVAEMARQQGDPARAAALFEAAEAWPEARDCYAQAGQRDKVAELSEQLGEWAQAAQTWEALKDLERAADAYCKAEDWPRAAQLYERAGALPEAAVCYEKAGDWGRAARLYERVNRLDDAARCYRQTSDWRQVARLERQRGQFADAATAFMQAARQIQVQEPALTPARETDLAELWSAAEDCCVKDDDPDRASECRLHVARYRHKPYVEMTVAPPEQMFKGRYALLQFNLKNVGGGPARQVIVHHIPNDFTGELEESRSLRDLPPSESIQTAFSIRPLVSGPVPLGVNVDYRDDAGEVVRITYQSRIDVTEPQSSAVYNVHIQSATGLAIGDGARVIQNVPAPLPVAPAASPPLAMVRTYADFDLLIGHPHGDVYPVHVLDAPAGETQGDFHPPFKATEWAAIKDRLHRGQVDEATLRGWGRQLFEALFRDRVATCFASSRSMTAQGMGLRLRLRVEPATLSELPWELLYDPYGGEFLALSARSPVVRHLHVGRPAQLPPLAPPLHMLIVAASPQDLPPLDIQNEIAALRAILKPMIDAGQVQVHVLTPPTAQALREYLLDHPCHLLHFVGHGGVDAGGGYLVLEDEQKRADRRDAATFCRLGGGKLPRFVMLNACLTASDTVQMCERGAERAFAGVAPALVRAGVTAVVAMQFPVSDRGAQIFSADFYRMLARRRPVDEAVDQARIAVTIELGAGSSDWAAPVLFLRGNSGDIFPTE